MTKFEQSIKQLIERLPELEWKLGVLGNYLNPKLLPRGLFRDHMEMTAQSCIDEIKADLQVLKKQHQEQTAYQVAAKISEKINVLVRICQLHNPQSIPKPAPRLNLETISTRQQWLQTMQDDLAKLTAQQQALLQAQALLEKKGDTPAKLTLQAELGEVERRLTLIKEAYAKALEVN